MRRRGAAGRGCVHRSRILHEILSRRISRRLTVVRATPVWVNVVEIRDGRHASILALTLTSGRLTGLTERRLAVLRLVGIGGAERGGSLLGSLESLVWIFVTEGVPASEAGGLAIGVIETLHNENGLIQQAFRRGDQCLRVEHRRKRHSQSAFQMGRKLPGGQPVFVVQEGRTNRMQLLHSDPVPVPGW
jgi:hypothetical protein